MNRYHLTEDYEKLKNELLEKYPVFEGHFWTWPSSYFGADLTGMITVVGWHRDSDLIARCNGIIAQEMLETLEKTLPEPSEDGLFGNEDIPESWVMVEDCNHFLVGWVKCICVRMDSPPEILDMVATILKDLESYPILDDDLYSEMEWKEEEECWDAYGASDFRRHLVKEEIVTEDDLDDVSDDDLYTVYRIADSGNSYHDGHGWNFDHDPAGKLISEDWNRDEMSLNDFLTKEINGR